MLQQRFDTDKQHFLLRETSYHGMHGYRNMQTVRGEF